jgi:polysaccharide export outer membrane protein
MKCLSALLCVLSLFSAAFVLAESAYQLKEGDVIQISVWGEDRLNQETLVLPDGSVSFPLVGNMKVGGLSAPEVESVISEALEEFIPGADVSVVVTSTAGNLIYILGKVKAPGTYVMAAPMSVIQALSLSGGLETFANESDILIVRNSGGAQSLLEVDYSDILSGKDISSNYQLEAGDTVMVP